MRAPPGCTAALSVGERGIAQSPGRACPSASLKTPKGSPGGMICSNKHCRRTSPGDGPTCRWHVRNYGSEDEPVHVTLCNACKINFDQGKYCPYCVQIYREKDPDSFDGKEWIGCTNKGCRRWVHADCELAEGADGLPEDRPYQCPPCRENWEAGEKRRLGRHNAGDRLANGERSGLGSPDVEGTRSERASRQTSPPEKSPVLAKSYSWNGTRQSSQRLDYEGSPSSSMRHTPPLRVDLSKLQASSLRRYKRVYKLRDAPNGCKETLKMAVAQHFASLVVNEEDIFRSFIQNCLRKHQTTLASVDHAASMKNFRRLPKPKQEQGVS